MCIADNARLYRLHFFFGFVSGMGVVLLTDEDNFIL
jgi:hypothetical protein